MQVLLTQPTNDVGAMGTVRKDAVGSDYLKSLQFSGLTAEETYVKSMLPPDGMHGKDVLSEDDMNQRQIMKDFGIDATHILLGAVWVHEDSWHEFLRYPECLFVDATHRANNRSRLML
jgi:hypothetical protein